MALFLYLQKGKIKIMLQILQIATVVMAEGWPSLLLKSQIQNATKSETFWVQTWHYRWKLLHLTSCDGYKSKMQVH
jgi:hypothetical protein